MHFQASLKITKSRGGLACVATHKLFTVFHRQMSFQQGKNSTYVRNLRLLKCFIRFFPPRGNALCGVFFFLFIGNICLTIRASIIFFLWSGCFWPCLKLRHAMLNACKREVVVLQGYVIPYTNIICRQFRDLPNILRFTDTSRSIYYTSGFL